MAWWYLVDGGLRFPTADGPAAWRAAPLMSWRGKGRVTVGQALGWVSKDRIFDESAPPEFRNAYFFEVADDGAGMALRGLIHRDDESTIQAVLDVAAKLGAEGTVLLDHALDPDSGIRLDLANGSMTAREGDVRMPRHVSDEINRASVARARRLDRGEAPPAPKPTTKTPKTKTGATAKGMAGASAKTKPPRTRV